MKSINTHQPYRCLYNDLADWGELLKLLSSFSGSKRCRLYDSLLALSLELDIQTEHEAEAAL